MKCTNVSYEISIEKIFIPYIFELFVMFSLCFHYVHGCDRKLDFTHFHRIIHMCQKQK